jgi:hypothetical protein
MHINEARGVLQALCEGLDKVHAGGLAHGDLRTDHVVLVRRDGQLSGVLVDFGIDRLAGARPGGSTPRASVLLGRRASRRSASARHAGRRGLGRVRPRGARVRGAHGQARVHRRHGIDLVVAHLTQEPEAPSKVAPRGWVTKDLDAVVLKALAKDPADRYASAGAFFDAILEAVKGRARAGT